MVGFSSRLKILVVSGAALAVSSAFALAADMPGNSLPPPRTEFKPPIIDFLNGWYIRGDIGAIFGRVNSATSPAPFANPTDSHLGNGMTGSFGVGIKGSWLRTDLTINYLTPLKYRGSVLATDDTTAKIQTAAAMFNGYLDLGSWYRATPYIGGGVGAAYVTVSDVAGPAALLATDTVYKQWKFAWAGMAGVAFPISHNMQVDLGYRYLNVGDVKSSRDAAGATTFKDVAGHEIRIGMRWNFDELRYAR
ncbi:MAG: outer membrane beta-barrel protein [Pseudolabrys sp.]